ncbi:hypothetical protein CGCF415_v012147 [Colletotrichum fructicola]|uniref:Uncharacterized protein n=1 Tax=Colletotrichum fructicola (strain Nara gc5) TaxID=1213859 RepID=L2G5G2_COLFN|nr:uncharacterized protein CGMCC3_g15897 [Colletotrichum fructicola]KAF4489525.1 hypothetical protein CGGC5_v004373 [Colletotrichum fructicola Nara gc5]KAI8290819.1 hypothetical protein K4K60_004336 [Colletotrichum sp. SAR11_57]KAE9567928.1 hypothetical protein CGMCC3_g15897 [Colletotrichum fructicola]KAF4425713.1 hypothetical protein CFRS1_v000129 [Colletotrichum fructicola]KAF4888188.1 hypothetical protein CGCFRS4_v009998 [Colletotrichum fructicola]
MPSLPIEAREVALDLVARVTSSRVSSSGSRVRTGARVIGGGIIAAIVIGAVVGIALIILAFCLFRRHKRQRANHDKEMQKYYGDNRSSMGSINYNPNNTNPQGGYNYGQGYGQQQGYGYAHTAAPGQYGYGAPNNGGVSGMPPAHTADHVTTK